MQEKNIKIKDVITILPIKIESNSKLSRLLLLNIHIFEWNQSFAQFTTKTNIIKIQQDVFFKSIFIVCIETNDLIFQIILFSSIKIKLFCLKQTIYYFKSNISSLL